MLVTGIGSKKRKEVRGAQRVPLEDWMERHTVSTQDPAASLLSVACINYQLCIGNYFTYVACKIWLTLLIIIIYMCNTVYFFFFLQYDVSAAWGQCVP